MEIDRDEVVSENCEQIQFDNIPESILVEVLIRLPVKLVFTFKLVCKQWRSVISDQSFALMYVARSLLFPRLQPWTFISPTMYVDGSQGWYFSNHPLLVDIYCQDIEYPSLHNLRCPSAQQQDKKIYMIHGVSNGLVLYGLCFMTNRFDYISNYSICNPITQQWITLPPHARRFKIVSKGFVTRVENSVLTSYRIVHRNVLSWMSDVITFEVFFSETGEWKVFNVHLDLETRFVWPQKPTSLNGILHWITCKHEIIAYDPYHKPGCVHIIILPGNIPLMSNNITYIGVPSLCDAHQGRLRYFEMSGASLPTYGFSSFSVWVLNDYSTGDWSLQHRIDSSDIIYDAILSGQKLSLNPISFHPFDSNIVYLGYGNSIVSYNIETRELEGHGVPLDVEINYKDRPHWWLVFLLITPPWPVYVPPPSFGVVED